MSHPWHPIHSVPIPEGVAVDLWVPQPPLHGKTRGFRIPDATKYGGKIYATYEDAAVDQATCWRLAAEEGPLDPAQAEALAKQECLRENMLRIRERQDALRFAASRLLDHVAELESAWNKHKKALDTEFAGTAAANCEILKP